MDLDDPKAEWVTISIAARMTGKSESHIRRLVAKHDVESRNDPRFGRKKLWNRAQITRAAFSSGRQPAVPQKTLPWAYSGASDANVPRSLTADQAVDVFGVSMRTIRRAAAEYDVSPSQLEGRIYYDGRQLHRALEERASRRRGKRN